MFSLSIIDDKNPGKIARVEEVQRFSDLSDIILSEHYSPSQFTGTIRCKADFQSADFIALDVDSGSTLEQAIQILNEANKKFLIATTRSHQQKKNGEAADRFRVIMPLAETIANGEYYRLTLKKVAELLPFVDDSCLEEARFFYKSKDVIYESIGGTPIETTATKSNLHKKPRKRAATFLKSGANRGQWHDDLYSTCRELRDCGYTIDETTNLIHSVAIRHGDGKLDKHDTDTIQDAYTREPKPEYSPPQIEAIPTQSITFPTPESQTEAVKAQRAQRLKSIENRLSFISPFFDEAGFFLGQGLTVIGAVSGDGKSTTAANILCRFIETDSTSRRILLITNEETAEAALSRTACGLHGIDYIKYRGKELPAETMNLINNSVDRLNLKVQVIDGDMGDLQTTNLEDIKTILENAKKAPDQWAMVILAYYQTVYSSNNPNLNDHGPILKQLGNYMKSFVKDSSLPLIVFAQLKNADEFSSSVKNRLENDKHLYNHAYNVIEIVKDIDTRTTRFNFDKTRFAEVKDGCLTLRLEGTRFTQVVNPGEF
ncbi:MAG: hypothetical protein KDD68_05230 [Bdellovibrionales bacterium]|nr:hypothetical protein [Bdellovibrionales bacterium]